MLRALASVTLAAGLAACSSADEEAMVAHARRVLDQRVTGDDNARVIANKAARQVDCPLQNVEEVVVQQRVAGVEVYLPHLVTAEQMQSNLDAIELLVKTTQEQKEEA